MSRTPLPVALTLALAVVVGWLLVPAEAPRAAVAREASEARAAALAPLPAAAVGARAPVAPAPGAGGAPEAPAQACVGVHGRVRLGGRPLAGYELVFRAPGDADGGDVDWDFTEDDGSYAVRLPPGRYVVPSAAGGAAATLVVPAGRGPLRRDLDLALGE